ANSEEVATGIDTGIEEAVAFGTTLIGDISSGGASWAKLAKARLRSVVFFEMLGLSEERVAPERQVATAWARSESVVHNCRSGLSPHAPYSAHADLFTHANAIAQEYSVPLATHLAETNSELELLHHHEGEFVIFLKGLGVWNPDGLLPNPARVMKYC